MNSELVDRENTAFDIGFSKQVPKIIYKYRDWGNFYHRRLLLDNEIYFSSCEEFNDPFDLKIPLRYDLLTQEEWRAKYWYILKETTQLGYYPYSNKDISKEVDRLMVEGLQTRIDLLEGKQQELLTILGQSIGIFCCSQKCNNILMWSHYANCHQGFCVGFNSKALFDSTGATIGPIIYSMDDKLPSLKPSIIPNASDSIKQTMYKSSIWSYEAEIRLFKFLQNVGDKLFTVNPEVIAEVVLGCKMNEYNKDLILEYLFNSDRFKHVKVFNATKEKDSFKMRVKQIN